MTFKMPCREQTLSKSWTRETVNKHASRYTGAKRGHRGGRGVQTSQPHQTYRHDHPPGGEVWTLLSPSTCLHFHVFGTDCIALCPLMQIK